MPVNIIDTLKPKNNGSFPIVEAVDVAVTDELRLPEALSAKADASDLNITNSVLEGKASASEVSSSIANLQGQINQIEISASAEAVVAPEVAAARVSADGTEYSTLSSRLDAENEAINKSLDNITFTEFKNISEYVSVPYHFEEGVTYFVEVMSGRVRLSTRATEDGSTIDTIFGTITAGYKSTLFTASGDAEYLRIMADDTATIRVSLAASQYYGLNKNSSDIVAANNDILNINTQITSIDDTLNSLTYTEFADIAEYTSVPYEFDQGKTYFIEIMSGRCRLTTRETEDGETVDTIFGTISAGYKSTLFTASADASYLRIMAEESTTIRVSSVESEYYISKKNSSDIVSANASISEISTQITSIDSTLNSVTYTEFTVDSQYTSVPYHIDEGVTYYVELLEGRTRLTTRETEDGETIDTIWGTIKAAPASTMFTASADAEYLRIAAENEVTIRICSVSSQYYLTKKNGDDITVINDDITEINSEILSIDTEVSKFDKLADKQYTLSDFTADTFYRLPDVGETVDDTVLPSGAGNYSLRINVYKGMTIKLKGYSANSLNTFGVTDSSKKLLVKYDTCSTGVTVPITEDGFAFITVVNLTSLIVYGTLHNSYFNSYPVDVYAPYPQLPADGSSTSDFDAETVTTANIYAYLNSLVSKYSWLLKKEYIGKDATNTFDINRYVFADPTNEHPLATIYIEANEHGPVSDPRECSIIVCRFIKDLCEGHAKDNKFLSVLKKYFKIVVLPVQNPYGFDNSTRNNGNNVNINRNYPTPGWYVIEDPDKGASPGSEVETQYAVSTISEYNPQIALDLHCLGNNNAANDNKCHYGGIVRNSEKLTEIINSMKRDYNLTCTPYGSGDPAETSTGTAYFNQEGIYGMLLEFQSRDGATSDPNTALHTARIEEANYTFMMRILEMLMSDYDPMLDISMFK